LFEVICVQKAWFLNTRFMVFFTKNPAVLAEATESGSVRSLGLSGFSDENLGSIASFDYRLKFFSKKKRGFFSTGHGISLQKILRLTFSRLVPE